MKPPFVAAFFNFFLPGLGYIALQKRVVFGWLLIATDVLWLTWGFFEPSIGASTWIFGSIPQSFSLGLIAMTTNGIAFGYDAYQLAKEK